MSCLSYLSNYDLSDYFRQWKPSESKADLPKGSADYSGGLTDKGVQLPEWDLRNLRNHHWTTPVSAGKAQMLSPGQPTPADRY
ncbi:hypothetical protein [Endozoicomonas acroporae]|uniref:hypothetical protein n=1 Tax=Endozoicomonas acroporae TaxID=1701104 RepID=UPI003D7A2ED2